MKNRMRSALIHMVLLSAIMVAECPPCHCSKHPATLPSVTTSQQISVPLDQKIGVQLSPYALSPLTLCQAIRKTTAVVESKEEFVTPVNEKQRTFLDEQYFPYIKQKLYQFFSLDELQSYASHDYKELNTIAKNKGFSLQFPQFPRTQIGVLAIQDVLVKWLFEGKKDSLKIGDTMYDSVMLKMETVREGERAGQQNVHFFAQNPATTVVVKLLTKSNDIVYFVTKRDGELFTQQPTDAAIAQAIMKYSKQMQEASYVSADYRFNGVQFPMISYDVNPDVSWLELMRIGTASIAQAMQQVIFKMNEQGARAKAAAGLIVATAYREEHPKERLIIDKPFLVWIERPGVALPIFAGYMTKEYWKNPGEL